MKEGLTQKFIRQLGKINAPELFVGVARVLQVPLVDENGVREFIDVFNDTVDKFDKEKRKRQKEILQILKDANSCKEDFINGDSSENTEERGPSKDL